MDKPFHAFRRLTFGFTLAEMDSVRRQGFEAFIHNQLNPETLPEPPSLQAGLSSLGTLRLQTTELFREYGPPIKRKATLFQGEEQRRLRRLTRLPTVEAASARLLRAVQSPRQLQEILVDFWFNHFNVFLEKGPVRVWVGAYERDAIRPFVFGKFRDMLSATARHPAMLFYLDNWRNVAPRNPTAAGKSRGINENYARELLELHTLGVDGGYGQQDVRELARILTGWGLKNLGREDGPSVFFFDPERHDTGGKVLLGRPVAGKDRQEIEETLAFLAGHPSTARHISYKLAQLFVADNPPAALVEKLARRFQETDGDIRAILTTLFASEEFWDGRYYGVKFKTPFRYLVSCLRLLDITVSDPETLAGLLQQWGMPLYGCPTPDGYHLTQEAWLNPDALMRRIDFAANLTRSMSPREMKAAPDVDRLRSALGGFFGPPTLAALDAAPPADRLALALASPEFLRY